MMNKFLLLTLLVTPSLWAQDAGLQDASEEAIILNQELQFLEDSANNVAVETRTDTTSTRIAAPERARAVESESLEAKYFGEETDETIRTRAAAPKRRSN